MPSWDDLVSLAEHLRRARMPVSIEQIGMARRIIDTGTSAPQTADAASLATRLAPVFCKTAADQRRLPALVAEWMQPAGPGVSGTSSPPTKADDDSRAGPGQRGLARRLAIVGAAALVLLLASVSASLRTPRPFDIRANYFDACGQAGPAAGIDIVAGACKARTGADGLARCAAPPSSFPLEVRASGASAQTAYAGYAGWRGVLAPATLPALELPVPMPVTTGRGCPSPAAARTSPAPGSAAHKPAGDAEQPAYRRALLAGICVFALVLGAGLAWLRRSLVLYRRRRRHTDLHEELSWSMPVRPLAMCRVMRDVARCLRTPYMVDDGRLALVPTVRETARRGGLFSPVQGRKRERTFVVFIERRHAQDHHAMIAEALVAELMRNGVDIHAFRFEMDGAIMEAAHLLRRSAQGPDAVTQDIWTIERILSTWNADQCMLFCVPEALMAPYRPGLAGWFGQVRAAYRECVLVSLGAVMESGPAMTALQAAGVRIADLRSLDVDPAARNARDPRAGAAPTVAGHCDSTLRSAYQIHRAPPSRAACEALCASLRAWLGEKGFLWIQGCAIYPEIQWPVTHALGNELVRDADERETLLVKLSETIWFRQGYMPDWFRSHLIAQLGKPHARRLRDFYWRTFAQGVTGDGHSLMMQAPRRRTWAHWTSALAAMRQLAIRRQADAGDERIFIRFLYAGQAGSLEVSIPARIMHAVLHARPTPAGWLTLLSVGVGGVAAMAMLAAGAGQQAGSPPSITPREVPIPDITPSSRGETQDPPDTTVAPPERRPPSPSPVPPGVEIRLGPAPSNYKVNVTGRPTGNTLPTMGREFEFRFELDATPQALRVVKKVNYHLDHPSFRTKDYSSTRRSDNFSAGYRGWGCLSNVVVTITYTTSRDPSRFEMDMCAALKSGETPTPLPAQDGAPTTGAVGH